MKTELKVVQDLRHEIEKYGTRHKAINSSVPAGAIQGPGRADDPDIWPPPTPLPPSKARAPQRKAEVPKQARVVRGR